MKYAIFILLYFLSFVIPTKGQTTIVKKEEQIPVLYQQLARTSTDTTQLQILLQIARTYNEMQSDSALIVADRGITFATEVQYMQIIPRFFAVKGLYHQQQKHFDSAISYYQKQLSFAEKSAQPILIVDANNNLGACYRSKKQNELALASYKSALALAEKIESSAGIIYSSNNLGAVYAEMNMLKEAAEAYTKARDLVATKVRDVKSLAAIYYNLATIYSLMKNYSKAINAIDSVIAYRAQLQDVSAQAAALQFKANVYEADDKPYWAIEALKKAYHLEYQQQHLSECESIRKRIINIYKSHGNSDEELEHIILLAELYRKHDRIEEAAEQYLLATMLATELSKYDQALTLSANGIAIAQSMEYTTLLCQLYFRRGTVFFAKSIPAKAIHDVAESISCYQKNKDKLGVVQARSVLVQMYKKLHDDSLYIANMLLLAEDFFAVDSIASSAALINTVGDIFKEKKQYSKAIISYHRTLKISPKKLPLAEIERPFAGLAEIYALTMQLDSAYFYQQELRKIQQSSTTNDKPRKTVNEIIAEAKAQYEEEKNKAQQELYEKDFNLQQERLQKLEFERQLAAERENKLRLEQQQAATLLSVQEEKLRSSAMQAQIKEQQLAVLTKDKELREKQLEQEKTLRYGLVALGMLAVVVIIAIINLYLTKKKSADTFEQQNKLLQDANQEIARQNEILEAQTTEIGIVNTELSNRNEELLTINKQLEQLIAEKNIFLSIASHDLKNPLHSILLTTSVLKNYQHKLTPEMMIDRITNIEKTVDRMREIITNFLDFAALENGEINLLIERVRINEVAQNIVDDYMQVASAKKIQLHFTPSSTDLAVMADKSAVRQCLENFISNAVKYSPIQSEVFIYSEVVSAEDAITYIRVNVRDEGPGINDNDKEKLFQRFSKLTARPTAGESSTGLGLSIVKLLAESMKGKVGCKSVAGQGATFYIELPSEKQDIKQEKQV